MKFGENLLLHLTPEWKSQYLSYEQLKSLLYGGLENAPKDEEFAKKDVEYYFEQFEHIFFNRCEKNLNKINSFFFKKVGEMKDSYETLKRQLHSYKRDQILGANIRDFTKSVRVLQFEKLSKLKRSFEDLHFSIILLQKYRNVNCTGFRKILKKHDKLMKNTAGSNWNEEKVLKSNFVTYKTLDIKLVEIEYIITKDLKDNYDTAENDVQVNELLETLSNRYEIWTWFQMGLLFGILLIILLVLVFSSFFNTQISDVQVTLQLFRAPFSISLYLFFISLNFYCWNSFGVNYVLIFDMSPNRTRLDFNFLRLSLVYTVICVICLTSYINANLISIPKYSLPVVLLSVFLLLFLVSTAVFEKSRFWLLRKLCRVIMAPLLFVRFTDFWFGDQLNSLVPVLGDLEHTLCFYFHRAFHWSSNSTKHMSQCTDPTRLSHLVVLCLPAWFRFAQCVRRYFDTKQKFPHIANALKYGTSFFVLVCTYFKEVHYFHSASASAIDNQPSRRFIYLVIISHVINSCFTLWWDLVMDWGFFEKGSSITNFFLRSERIFGKKYLYYAAMIQNGILRFSWALGALMELQLIETQPTYIVATVVSTLEIFRRFIWNFIRLENEHLNNCGQFIAVRKIHLEILDENDLESMQMMMDEPDGVVNRRAKRDSFSPKSDV